MLDRVNQIKCEIEQQMCQVLNNEQMNWLQKVLECVFLGKEIKIAEQDEVNSITTNQELLQVFLAAKRVEGCSEKSITYYKTTLETMLQRINKSVKQVVTEDLRVYLSDYQKNSEVSKVTIDNIRRILSSFFSWLEDEDYILKSPARRIHKIRTGSTVKETYTDEELESMRDHCDTLRDLALIDMLCSTGMRVGELTSLNRRDVDFEKRECIVLGKGDKERRVYFDARTKIHLKRYLEERTDDNPALFVTLNKPNAPLKISGVEIRLRELGKRLNIIKVHPHKFRRTLATKAIDKGMPIEQVQVLLGHTKIDTTLQYAMVSQRNLYR
ncbi:MAG: tyrosine-type recombinase/integrase [Niameybacter sp.]|uniref:site-specific tyrosine recombinase/integron integrase n=2 Tax=Niameybacter sp. TaxID=2033640 RepID=UPI002FCAD73D